MYFFSQDAEMVVSLVVVWLLTLRRFRFDDHHLHREGVCALLNDTESLL